MSVYVRSLSHVYEFNQECWKRNLSNSWNFRSLIQSKLSCICVWAGWSGFEDTLLGACVWAIGPQRLFPVWIILFLQVLGEFYLHAGLNPVPLSDTFWHIVVTLFFKVWLGRNPSLLCHLCWCSRTTKSVRQFALREARLAATTHLLIFHGP